MTGIVQRIVHQHKLKKSLLAFLAEMEKNLESFYVMDQRQFISQGFSNSSWDQVKDQAIIKKHGAIAAYIHSIEEFNRLLKEHKEYEQWYAADMSNKTPDNGRTLHAMKHAVDGKLKTMDAVIIAAGQALEKEMLHLGWLK